MYPYRLVIISPLKIEDIKKHFSIFIADLQKYDNCFECYLEKECNVASVTAFFYEEEAITRKSSIFEQIASMGERLKYGQLCEEYIRPSSNACKNCTLLCFYKVQPNIYKTK